VSLIEGVTGSGKTEIYLRCVAEVIAQGKQALMLTPEIGLTPQLVSRFRERFGDAVGVFHSGLTDKTRADQWLAAAAGRCRVVIGTRSAVFMPLPDLALILVDEEHDASFKQQDGFRYSARDVAIIRGQQAGVPVILGSATPSLESLHNVRSSRYRHFRLQQRVGTRQLPRVNLLDLRGVKLTHGLSPQLLDATERHLNAGGQVLMFVNRRGYAPALLCHDCGWAAPCPHCDARLTLHRARGRLICHHCASDARLPSRCGQCSGTSLIPVGQGTERIEDALRERFPDRVIERIDSDRSRRAGEMTQMLDNIHSGQTQILVGTQMLAKGHDFERLSLVGVVCADEALYSADFRASERLGQLLTQVAGRAGRGERPGEVLVQTHVPQHPLLQAWLREGYSGLTQTLLDERRVASLPPFAHLALIRADALNASAPMAFLRAAADLIKTASVDTMGPIPAPMERKANRLRAQLMLRAHHRGHLQRLLTELIPQLHALPGARRIRWSVDVDPLDLY
ncbi:MAG: primosomal protein N', partial [Panacagrimonas sp.]